MSLISKSRAGPSLLDRQHSESISLSTSLSHAEARVMSPATTDMSDAEDAHMATTVTCKELVLDAREHVVEVTRSALYCSQLESMCGL